MGKHTMLMDQQTQQSKDGNSPQTDIWTTQFLLNSQQDFLYSQNYLKLTQKNKTTRIAKTILKKKNKVDIILVSRFTRQRKETSI